MNRWSRVEKLKAMSKPRGYIISRWDQMIPVYRLDGIRYGGGVNLIQAFMCNVGTCRSDNKGEIQVEDPQE